MKNIKKINSGSSLLETVFYVVILAALSVAAIDAMMIMTKSFRETGIYAELVQSGNIMEKISREIKQANGINTISASSLKLNTKDDAGADKTVTFSLSSGNIQFSENDVLTGNLNSPKITVSSLIFTEITTTSGKAIKVFLTLGSSNDSLARAYDFYDTIVLRGGY